MGHRASLVIVRDGWSELFCSHWRAITLDVDLFWGPALATTFVRSQRPADDGIGRRGEVGKRKNPRESRGFQVSGRGRIRTSEDISRQIYSLMRLATSLHAPAGGRHSPGDRWEEHYKADGPTFKRHRLPGRSRTRRDRWLG